MRRHRLAAFIVVAALIGGPGVAHAAIPKGTYSGKTSDGGTVKITVNSEQRLTKLYRKGLAFSCTNGTSFKSAVDATRAFYPIRKRKFELNGENLTLASKWDWSFRFNAEKRRVTGKYSETRTLNEQGAPDRDGTITCKTAALTYSAALPKK